MRIDLRLLIFVILLCAISPVTCAEVRVWRGTLRLPAYEEGPPDPNPPFDQFGTSRFSYPYTLRSNLTDRRVEHDWRAIYLENEYLKCSVLPDIGGHLYTCIDKISGKPMFYANPSIKKANIGYRGAWAAFGIEFNFPVSHNWVSMSPVDFAFAKHDDGTASVTVGNVDRVYGMEWSVELILRPQSTVLEEKVRLSNRSDMRHRFYWWNNAALEVWDDSRIEYPMRFAASHGFTEVQPWPVDPDGIDLSVIRNQTKGPVSLFVHGSREPFMGVWNPHSNTGVVHYAEYAKLPAKKIWSWGVDADGLDWRKALSDNNSAYVEIQAGLFRNQETYAFLEPRQAIEFSEYWMPVREIGGISRANLAGVVHMSRESDKLVIGFNANQPTPRATVRMLDGEQTLFEEKAELAPDRTWRHTLPLANPQHKYTFEVRDDAGGILLRHTEGNYDWTPESEIAVGPQSRYHLPPTEKRTEDDWLQLGKMQELDGQLLVALATYQEALGKFPESFAARKAAGRLAAGLGRLQEAVEDLKPVTERDTTDAEAAYYLGIAYDGLGDSGHARTVYEVAYRSPQFLAAAGLRLGELAAREKDLSRAERYLSESLTNGPGDVRTAEELVAVRRALGNKEEAQVLALQWLRRFPLSYFLRDQLGVAEAAHLANDPARILNIASEYIRLGLYRPALGVLTRNYPAPLAEQSEPGTQGVRKNPLIGYFRAFCRKKVGEPFAADYEMAPKLPTAYIFPSGEVEFEVLQAAVAVNASDATAHYLLGTLYFSRGMTDPALTEWERAENLNAGIPVLDASMGLAILHEKNDPQRALEAFRRGLRNDPENIANYVGLDQASSQLGEPSAERIQVLEKYSDRGNTPPEVIYELILNLTESGDFERATALFHDRFFAREEGGTNVRQVWVEVQLQRAISMAGAGRCSEALKAEQDLGSAVPGLAFTENGLAPMLNTARTNYLLAEIDSTCKEPGKAKTHLAAAVAKSAPDQIVWAWMAARKLPSFNPEGWEPRLRAALAEAASLTETSSFPSYWFYAEGMIEDVLGKSSAADPLFQRAFLLPDRMLAYHLTRLARARRDPQ
jgi:tetratricopeptide (TPR) repeat protein